MKIQTITGTVNKADGTAWTNAGLEFQLDSGSGRWVGAGIAGVTDGSGNFSVQVYNNAPATCACLVRLPDDDVFSFSLDPSQDSVAIGTLQATSNVGAARLTEVPSSGGASLSKATGAEVNTGTDDAKYVTAKAIEDSSYIKDSGIAPAINAATAKSAIVNADLVGLVDTEASNVLKKVTWTSIKAFLKTYFDTLYPGGTTGATDNAILRADGTGGATVQSSPVTMTDAGTINLPTDQAIKIATFAALFHDSGNNCISVNSGLLGGALRLYANGLIFLGAALTSYFDNATQRFTFPFTYTAGGTTGNQTIDKVSGSVNIVAGGSSVTVTSSVCAANSIVFAVVMTNDTTALIKNVVVSAGSFIIRMNANVTAETKIGFWIINS